MTAAIGSDRTEGLTVAIVDDDRDMRETLKVVLEDEGFTVLHAPSGLRLIGILSVDRPDLILLDVRMAWVDGFALCRALKASPRFREIPICFLSALSSPDRVRQGLACGAAAYLAKPFDPRDLVATVRRLTQRPVESVTGG